jgi:cell wall-associated NlpC family hydrolase
MARISGWRRGAAIAAVLVFGGGLAIGATQLAGAAPQPTLSQVEAKINSLQAQYDKAGQQYDAYSTKLTAAKARLAQVNTEVAVDNARYQGVRKKVVEIASASYMDSGQTSLAGLLTTSDPGTVLGMASLITQLTGARNLEARQLLADAQQLTSVQQEQRNYEQGVQQVTNLAALVKSKAKKALDLEQAYYNNLNAQQQAAVQATTVGGSSSSAVANPVNTVPTNSQAGAAVAFVIAKAQARCPYLYGGTGPCSVGYDCSGLMQAAWAAAGVSIPRDTYSQYAALPHIPLSDLRPGDLIFYNGLGHVAMYVGGGMIVDAPRTGLDVEEIPMSTSWYASSTDGAARP